MKKIRQIAVKSILLVILSTFFVSFQAFASNESAETHTEMMGGKKKLDVKGHIFGHVSDAYDWHLFDIGEHPVSVPLPVILYNTTHGKLDIFLSSKFEHGHKAYNGYELYLDPKSSIQRLKSVDESSFIDISIKKNVLSLFISIALLLIILTKVAKKYKQHGPHKAPSGFQNVLEPVIEFIEDNVSKPFLGNKSDYFMPFLLTIFFFIWVNNMLGLLPFGFNLTGNIEVTLVLALVFYFVMLVKSNKHFWGHMLNPPGVPLGVKFILVPIEILSNLLIKPVALAIRLFANIFAGHTIILSIILLIFIFAELSSIAGISFIPISVGFSIFMFFLELLVAAIQAFIFTNLTAVFIGQAIEEHHHDTQASGEHH
ncbi:MAG: F0F1 ATP synthase subunit A [Chitinophagaceae bacterium]|nr:F0F1 ATP synthase subunit A [Chitinophagaceae bacterium]